MEVRKFIFDGKEYSVIGDDKYPKGHAGAFPSTHCYHCGARYTSAGYSKKFLYLCCPDKNHNYGSVAELV